MTAATLAPPPVAAAATLEEVPCAICGSREQRELYPPLPPGRELSPVFAASTGVRGATRIVRCVDCGLAYVSPRLRADLVAAAYREGVDPLYVAQAGPRRRSFRRNLAYVARYRAPGRLLDVGCAAGYFLDVCAEAGWSVCGIEPNRGFVADARLRHGDRVAEGSLADGGSGAERTRLAGPFDVITMWDVLEHATDPRVELQAAYRLLKPGGLLFVNFPDIGSLAARLTGSAWWFLLSHHLYYFTPRSLTALLESEGFSIVARSRYWQTLELGYLAGMLGLYSPSVASLLAASFRVARVDRLPISYTAGQITLVAAR